MTKSGDLISSFEKKFEISLNNLSFDFGSKKTLGLAVSGGADSISLLLASAALSKKYDFALKVITVDHNIRSAEESGGDAHFVEDLCSSLKKSGYRIDFFKKTLFAGQVEEFAKTNRCGIEAAARDLRYQAFDKVIKQEGLSFFALAHNQNDQIETLLMRFLQGSSSYGMSGIQKKRDCFIRPLLDFSRGEIEEYLKAKNQSWRTDSTNFDNKYFRNRIRNELVPFLKDRFPGFETALISAAEKNSMDRGYIEENVNAINWHKKKECVFLERNIFALLADSLKVRFLYKAANLLGEGGRLPFTVIKEILRLDSEPSGKWESSYKDLIFSSDGKYIYIKKKEIVATDSEFFAIIEEDGIYELPFGRLICKVQEGNKALFEYGEEIFELNNIFLPFCLRSCQIGDCVRTSENKFRAVNEVFSSWHVAESERRKIPLLQDLSGSEQEIKALLGCIYGYENWIVK
ncbi:MAG: tRNA lysidine(34) synthetase TilS [Treponema sp.]|nr:tRNA lysidine(34) synthetase TilS [Treponema sp.]